MTSKPHSERLEELAEKVAFLENYLTAQKGLIESAKSWKAEVERLEEQLETARRAGNVLADKASQYLDTGRGDLDGAIALWHDAYPASIPPEPEYRLWVNPDRTVLVRLWKSGVAEVANRETPEHTWGPPIICDAEMSE